MSSWNSFGFHHVHHFYCQYRRGSHSQSFPECLCPSIKSSNQNSLTSHPSNSHRAQLHFGSPNKRTWHQTALIGFISLGSEQSFAEKGSQHHPEFTAIPCAKGIHSFIPRNKTVCIKEVRLALQIRALVKLGVRPRGR